MGKILHHFGDSYGTNLQPDKHFVELISDKMGCTYKEYCVGGSSNEGILNELLKRIHTINSGDIMFFNFSFFTRGSYYNKQKNTIESTNTLYSDMFDTKKMKIKTGINYDFLNVSTDVRNVLDYQLDNSEDYNRRIFHLFNTLFIEFIKRDITIYYLYAGESEWDNSTLLSVGQYINFPNGFFKWLTINGYHKSEDVHYTKGIQPILCDIVLSMIN